MFPLKNPYTQMGFDHSSTVPQVNAMTTVPRCQGEVIKKLVLCGGSVSKFACLPGLPIYVGSQNICLKEVWQSGSPCRAQATHIFTGL
jgi:hypothetical protein